MGLFDIKKNTNTLLHANSITDVLDPGHLFGGGAGAAPNLSPWLGIGGIEAAAGATAPKYQSLRDVNGDLASKYKIDPFSGAASKKLRDEALGTGPSEWAKNATEQQKFEEGNAAGRAGLQQQASESGARSNLMRLGGLGGGARTSLARSGARDLLQAKQGVAGQGIAERYSINDADAQRKQQLLGTSADIERQADLQNLGTLTGDIQGQSAFDMDRYKQILQAYGANQTANATAMAGAKGGGGKK